MVLPSAAALARVLKTTGGKAWAKPWGIPGRTRAQKRNLRDVQKAEAGTRSTLADAAAREPAPAAPQR